MGMTIDEAIATIKDEKWICCQEKYIEALNLMENIMRKYQKIQEIVEERNSKPPLTTLNRILKVVEDGMRIDDEIYVHGYLDEIRQDKVIIRNEGGYFGTVVGELVEAIPKDQFEAKLKADLKAILVELQLEIEEIEVAKENTEIRAGEQCMKGTCIDLIQQKIDKLKGNVE